MLFISKLLIFLYQYLSLSVKEENILTGDAASRRQLTTFGRSVVPMAYNALKRRKGMFIGLTTSTYDSTVTIYRLKEFLADLVT